MRTLRPLPSPFWLRLPSVGSTALAEPSRPWLNCFVSSRLSCRALHSKSRAVVNQSRHVLQDRQALQCRTCT